MFDYTGGRIGLPGYQGDLVDISFSRLDNDSSPSALMISNNNDSSPSKEQDRTLEETTTIEDKRKDMVHDLLNTACGSFRFPKDNEEEPNSPRSVIGENEMDKEKQLFRFQCFVEYCLVHTKPKKDWKVRRANESVSQEFTCADEALAVLTLENNCKDWLMLVDGKVPAGNNGQRLTDKVARKHSKSVYTTWGARKRDGQTNKTLQWTSKGIKRYNVLFDMIKEERERQYAVELEEELRIRYESMQGAISKEVREVGDYDRIMNEYEQPRFDF